MNREYRGSGGRGRRGQPRSHCSRDRICDTDRRTVYQWDENSSKHVNKWVAEYDSTHLLLHLESVRFLSELEARDTIDGELMIEVLKAIVKCIESPNRVLLNRFLSSISAKSVFFRLHVNEYLTELENEVISSDINVDQSLFLANSIEPKIQSIADLLLILKELFYLFPNQMSPICSSISNLTKTIREIHQKKQLSENVLGLLKEVESANDTSKARKKYQNNEVVLDPPDDFRSIPVIPTGDDVHNKNPFLRKNIIDHNYRDVDHYLDIHFRLMREDFLRPLRCGIQEYLNATNAGQRLHRLQGSFVYHNVRVTGIELSENGLLVRFKLNLATMPKVNWNTTRRLMFGSLLCLSSNLFEDFIVATVGGRRDPYYLQLGKFEGVIDPTHEANFLTVINESPDQIFAVFEPLSYFEAYRHILKCLQEFNEDTFPLKKYIVNVDTRLTHPEYLNEASKYDFSRIKSGKCQSGATRNIGENVIFEAVNVLKTDSWPTAEEFGMDESQYVALKDALTREVSVIQGPPGTGKTFIGLRIVETLMRNRKIWDEDGSNTILVTCYTNHALDQFLEGIEPFCKQLLRIGGRCQSENIQKYCLKDLRSSKATRVPKYITDEIDECRSNLWNLMKHINDILSKINETRNTLLPYKIVDIILDDINELQAMSLISLMANEVHLSDDDAFKNCLKVLLGYYEIDYLKFDDEVQEVDEDEEEVKRLEGERNIDAVFKNDDDFKHLVFDNSIDENVKLTDRGWKFKQYFLRQVNNDDIMDIDVARRITDVTTLNLNDRWRLYRLWQKLFIMTCVREDNNVDELKDAVEIRERIQALKIEEVMNILKDVKIIGVTTTGAAKNRSLISRLKPKIVIVEEAAEILESHIITSLTSDTKHLILIGDHIQLQPNATVYDLAVNFNLNVSLFERMIRKDLISQS